VIPDAATTLNDPTVTNAVVTIAGFTIDSGGVVNDGGSSTRLTVNGPVVLNGTWNGAGRLLLNAGAATLDGSGTFNGNRIDPVSGARTILSTANLTVTRIDVRANNTVTNYGSVTATTITGNDATTAIWINEANSTLKVSGELFDTKPGTLTATANPNTVEYNGAVQTVEPATYHHLILSGSGAKTAGRVVTTNGNLTVNNGVTFSTAYSVNAGGDWTVDGTFGQTAGTTTFTGGGAHTCSGAGSSQFKNLTTSSQTINAGSCDLRISGVWIHGTAGIFNEQTSTVTFNGSGVQTQPTITYVPQLYNMTINKSGGTMSTRVWTVTNDFLLTNGAFDVSSNSSFKNFTISGGTFTAPAGNVNAAGNWTNNGGTFTSGTGTVTFNGSSAQTIGGTSATTFNNLTVSNTSGDVTLSGVDATVNGTGAGALNFTSGKIITGVNTLIIGASTSTITGAGTGQYVYGNLQKAFNTGSGQTFTFEIGDASYYTPAQLANFNVTTAGNITANTTAARHPEFMTANIGDKYVKRYWTLTPGSLVTSGYDITATFVSGDLVGVPDTNALIVQKYNPSTWSNPASSSSTSTTVTGVGFTSFSDFFSGNGGTPTPVTLSYFNTQRNGDSLQFDWSTATETGNVGFNLYAEKDGELVQVNDELIPSQVIDSLDRLDYRYQAGVGGSIFYIEDVSVLGETRRHGPFQLGEAYGGLLDVNPIDWAAIQAEHSLAPASAPLTLDQVQAIPDEPLQDDSSDIAEPKTPEILPILPLHEGRKEKPVPSASPIVNLQVRQTGLYRVTYEMLRDAGYNLSGVPASKLQLTNRGQAVPIYLKGSSKFGPGAYFEFYAQALDTLYTDTNIYSLQVGPPAPRITSSSAAPGKGLTPPVSYSETLTVNNQRLYANFTPTEDPWYDTAMLTYKTSKNWDFPFQVSGLADPGLPSNLEVVVWGGTSLPQSPDHHLVVRLNGAVVADQTFDGLPEQVISVALPANLLVNGGNTLQLTLPGDTTAAYDGMYLDKFSLTYQRTFQAQDGRLTFTDSGKVFTVTNLPTRNVTVYRLDKKGPVRLSRLQAQASDSTFNVTFAGTGQSATYLVSAVESLYVPAFQAPRPTAALNRPAQYLIISHPDFIAGLQPLIRARQAQGLTVNVVDVNDVYAQYGYGIFDPRAIQQYISFARKNLGTQYVLLVGGDTYDYRNYLGRNSISFIPSLYASTGPYVKFVPADPLFADGNGDNVPDLAIGRFPVRTNAELDLMVSKTLAYAGKNYGRTAVFASDKFDGIVNFKNINLGFAANLPAGWTTENIHLDDLTVTAAQEQLIAAMNRGAALVTFTGHSGPSSWTFSNLFNTTMAASLTNAGRPFVVVQWGCWNTYYVNPTQNFLVQSLLFSGDKGAAAVLGASTLTDSESENLLGQLFTPRLVMPGASIGQALFQAKVELAQSHPDLLDVLLGWSLMGDPALVVEPQ